ncbi:hypothetical protein SAMCFNEI73_pB0306 (plasmid) [Sinorhizobium americanum]|uniref:Alpha/beta hydrolase n=2 Tax=Sinorhizobium americanum TaxID=194963 RepID=A0A1L3LTW2_9HYPH|nr:hypothetical protein SAMCFNEI73_pB0306 [Sinorhizobium americanum]
MAFAEGVTEATTRAAVILLTALSRHIHRIGEIQSERLRELLRNAEGVRELLREARDNGNLGTAWREYLRDAIERAVLTTDAFRERGDIFLEHEAAGCPPVLFYHYEVMMDGRDLPFKSNYMLLRIIPPEGVAVDNARRPYIIICPRAGHGPGVGGHKSDSQVGVALREGHPVYFVAFRREPEHDQYLSYVTRTEAAFVREVMRRHPNAPKPVLVGDCQGGWATLVLAATNPDLTGPIVINGAPVTPIAGKVGENIFRYNAGLLGGTWIPMFLSDLGGGIFDGAHLAHNFELLNPERPLRKYTDLFRDVDTARETFLATERWWGSFCLLHENEIRWIIEQLFVGNRLVKNKARVVPERRHVELKLIRAPIIVFTSHGDNVTPPQQALNWIGEIYESEQEIRILGQRIVYLVHDDVDHLGIIISSNIVNKEYSEVATTLEVIEALVPGLYEMRIQDVKEDDVRTRYTVELVERSLDDIRALGDGHDDERAFAAVSHASEVQAQIYHTLVRPSVKAAVTEITAEISRAMHPQRLSRALMSSKNPMMAGVKLAAEQVREGRAKAAPENPFLAAEALWVRSVEQAIAIWRHCRDLAYELTFHSIWNTPWVHYFSDSYEAPRTLMINDDLRALPEVAMALSGVETGGFAEAVIRMLVLLSNDRGGVRRDRLERWSHVLAQDEPFRSLDAELLKIILRQQTLIASYEPEQAIETLPLLLTDSEERRRAYLVVRYVPGTIGEMSPHTVALLQRFAEVLGQPWVEGDLTDDPLAM